MKSDDDFHEGLKELTKKLNPGLDLSDLHPNNVKHEVLHNVDGQPIIQTTISVPQCCSNLGCVQLKEEEDCTPERFLVSWNSSFKIHEN